MKLWITLTYQALISIYWMCYFLEFLAGEDPLDSATWHQPTLTIGDLQPKSLSGLKIGIDWKHFRVGIFSSRLIFINIKDIVIHINCYKF